MEGQNTRDKEKILQTFREKKQVMLEDQDSNSIGYSTALLEKIMEHLLPLKF